MPPFLVSLTERNDFDALWNVARAYDAQGSKDEAEKYVRRMVLLRGGDLDGHATFENWAKERGYSDWEPRTAEEVLLYADTLLKVKNPYATRSTELLQSLRNFGDDDT